MFKTANYIKESSYYMLKTVKLLDLRQSVR